MDTYKQYAEGSSAVSYRKNPRVPVDGKEVVRLKKHWLVVLIVEESVFP